MTRQLTFAEAIREGTEQMMEEDRRVFVMGQGVTDPSGSFGTSKDLHKRFGPKRAFDLPVSDSGVTGVAIGSALGGMRPILTHQRLDFSVQSLAQLINSVAKWYYMFGEQTPIPLVLRITIGHGWGHGPQHTQSLHSLFSHIPGLRIALPATPADAKGLLVSSIRDPNPVIILEHSSLYESRGHVPVKLEAVPLGCARVALLGERITLAACSYMVVECLRAADLLRSIGIEAEVIDFRCLNPLDKPTLLSSISKTGHLLVVDGDWQHGGFASELIASLVNGAWDVLKAAPQRIYWPTDSFYRIQNEEALNHYSVHIADKVCAMLGLESPQIWNSLRKHENPISASAHNTFEN